MLLVVVLIGGLPVWALLVPMFVIVSSLPFVLPNTTALALADHAGVAGTASALLGVVQFMIGALAAPLVGVAGPDSAVPMGVVMVTLALGRARGLPIRRPAAAVEDRAMTLVTISASYGCGGSRIAPALAERLGVPFLGRPPAPDLDPEVEEPSGRLLSRLASLALAWGTPGGMELDELLPDSTGRERDRARDPRARRRRQGRHPRPRRRGDPARRRAGAARPARRAEGGAGAQAMVIESLDHEAAERRLARVDRFRRAYVETFYGVDLREAGICHLIIDSTAIPLDDCVELIAAAAMSRSSRRK